MKNLLYTVALACLCISNIQAQDTIPKKIYTTTFINDNLPKIDGLINDNCWDLVEWNGGYVEWSPDENTPPTE